MRMVQSACSMPGSALRPSLSWFPFSPWGCITISLILRIRKQAGRLSNLQRPLRSGSIHVQSQACRRQSCFFSQQHVARHKDVSSRTGSSQGLPATSMQEMTWWQCRGSVINVCMLDISILSFFSVFLDFLKSYLIEKVSSSLSDQGSLEQADKLLKVQGLEG